jgi:hypothetical protein
VYTKKGENEVSWFEENPLPSLELIAEVAPTVDLAIIDIGGGASRLVDSLTEKGFREVTVLDLSDARISGREGSAWRSVRAGSLVSRRHHDMGAFGNLRYLA